MAQRVRDILLRIRGDSSDAENDLHQLARELHRFDGIHAEATADINTQAAERKIASAKNAMQAFGRMSEEAKVDLQTRAADVKLQALRRNLENLQKRPVTPKVEIAVGRTVAQIERVEAQLDRLDRRRVDIDVDVGRGVAGGIAGGIGAAAQGLGLVVSAAARGIPVIGGLGQLFVQLGLSGAALGTVVVGVAAALTAVLLPALLLVTGAVVALGASFLAAAAGVGVLGVALAGAFGPVVLVAIAAMARFAKILEAVKATEQGAATSAQDAASAAQTHADALEAQADKAEAVSDAIRGIAQAELGREQARLGVKQAEQALADYRKEAGLTAETFDDLFSKFTDVSFRPQSLINAIQKSALGGAAAGGADPLQLQQLILNVRQARLSEQAAIDGVSDAHERLSDARKTETGALTAQTAALTEREEKLKGLTGTERRLVDVIVALKDALTEAFRPATQRIFEGVIDFLEDLGDFAKDRRVRGGLTAIGDAIGDMFRHFGRVLRNRETREAFGELARGGARLIRQLTPVFTGLFNLVMRVAQVALPWLETVIGYVGDAIRGWAKDADRSGIERFVRRVRTSFNIWIGIVEELWGIIKAFFGDAKASGDEFAVTIRTILRRIRLWLEANPDKIIAFFDAVQWSAKAVLDVVEKIVDAIKWISENKGLSGTELLEKTPLERIKGPSLIDMFNEWRRSKTGVNRQTGGPVPGVGSGDIIPAMLEPGEYVIRRSVAQAIGVPRLNLLNAGNIAALGGGRGMNIENQTIMLPPAPGHDQLGDPRHQAVQLARELRRRGSFGLAGGGIG